ncbi:hypothetical protein D9619_010572 [Psilocybe cf. subviscida]|uniref:F-box domain-containing protein n=1 Tax=Psilocybe cf. subviscida TaxID=2480587 RepID=A0A8H5ASM3_9AGAR|nr:hypothetical protein D9619_010572 [Psilocybe cf. subviscida]
MDSEEAQRTIDEETLLLQRRQNTHARISRLPNEVLVGIFTILRGDGGSAHLNLQAWHHIAHICQHWRLVCLESAILWTNPPTHLHDYTLLMLERSRTSPLEIVLLRATSRATCSAVLSHISRIKSLIIAQSHAVLQHFQRNLLALKEEAPLLEKLEIMHAFGASSGVFRLSASTSHLFPSLKTLCLSYIDFDWTIFPIYSLTSLTWICLRLSENPSWTQFYDALREMPSLEQLSFGFDDLELILPPRHVEPLQLPLLHTLEVTESQAAVTRSFLSSSSFPRLRDATLECSFSESSDLDDYSTTNDAVLPLTTNGKFGCLDQLTVADDGFTMSNMSTSDYNWKARHTIKFTANDWYNSNIIWTTRALMAGLAALPTDPTSALSRLFLSVDLLSDQLLGLFFGHLPQLESINGFNIGSQKIIEGLKISPLHPPELPIPFRKVNSIKFDGRPHMNEYTPELFEELLNCLTARYQYGAGMKDLFVRWDLTEGEAQRLREVVTNVEWRNIRIVTVVSGGGVQDDDGSEEDEDLSVGDGDSYH